MGKDGGTQLWCSNCKSIQICRVDSNYSGLDGDRGNVVYSQVPDLNSFRRPRICNNCEDLFWTDEVNEEWIGKLISLETDSGLTTLEGLQEQVADFATERDWDQFHTVKNLILALIGEVGELAEIVQWMTDQEIQEKINKTPEQELVDAIQKHVTLHSQLEEEVADVFIYLLRLSTVLDINLISAAYAKMSLNAQRYTIEKSKGNAEKQ